MPPAPRQLCSFVRPLLVLGLFLGLAAHGSWAADDPRAANLREQIRTLETVVAQANDPDEKARLDEKLQRLRQELAVLAERDALEAQERALQDSLPKSPLATLRARLRDIDATVDGASARAGLLVAQHQQAATERDALAGQVEAVRQQKGSADQQARCV